MTTPLASTLTATFWKGLPPHLVTSHPLPPLLRPSDDPLVGSIAQQYLADREAHDRTAAEWTKRYAQG